jgi:phage-related protein (TIGR01555 family)
MSLRTALHKLANWGLTPPPQVRAKTDSELRAANLERARVFSEAAGRLRASRAPLVRLPGAEGGRPSLVFQESIPAPSPGVIPAGHGKPMLAADSQIVSVRNFAAQHAWGGYGFMGYALLSDLAQIPEFRRPSSILANEMTREWGKFVSKSEDESKTDKINALMDEFDRLNVQETFRRSYELDNFFGIGHILIDTGAKGDELTAPLGDRLLRAKIKKGDPLKALRCIEPIWMYPNQYNAIDPLADDFYRPQTWFILSNQVNSSRLLSFNSRPVPDMLKPQYLFGGVSLTQLLFPYVQNWLETRQSVSSLISNFSTMVMSIQMDAMMEPGGMELLRARGAFYNDARNNLGLFMVDKDSEGFTNVSAPLGSLDKLQAQAQEQMAGIAGIPLVKLFGITPSGLNASSDGEIRAFYDTIKSEQERIGTPNITKLAKVLMMTLWGDIDDDIVWRWEPLWSLDEEKRAAVRKQEADTAGVYIDKGVLAPEEVRAAVAADENSAYSSIDVENVPDLQGEEETGLEPEGGRPQPQDEDAGGPEAAEDSVIPFSRLSDDLSFDDIGDFDEAKHPRAKNGQFGEGPGTTKLNEFASHRGIDQLSYEDNKKLAKELHEEYASNPSFKSAADIVSLYAADNKKSLAIREIVNQTRKGTQISELASNPNIQELLNASGLSHDDLRKVSHDTAGYFETLQHAPKTSETTYRGCKSFSVKEGGSFELGGPVAFSADQDSAMTYAGGVLIKVDPGARMLPTRAMEGSRREDEHATVPAFWSRSENKIHPRGVGHGFSIGIDTDRELTSSGKFNVLKVSKESVTYKDRLSGKKKTKTMKVVHVVQTGVGGPEAAEDSVVPFLASDADFHELLWALDEAKFEESKHPRDKGGQFSKGSGGGIAPITQKGQLFKGIVELPNEVKKNIYQDLHTAINNAAGEKGPKSLDQLKKLVTQLKGADKQKFFDQAKAVIEKHLPAKAEPAKAEPAKAEPAKVEPAKAHIYATMLNAGFTLLSSANGEDPTILQKGKSLLALEKSGSWTLQTPSFQTKKGQGSEALQALLDGDKAKFESLGVKNTMEQIPDHLQPKPAVPVHVATRKEIAKARPTPTQEEASAISFYKGSGYISMNDKLRHSGKHSHETKYVEAWLDRAELPIDVTVHRGIKGAYAKFLRSMAFEGSIFMDRGFISTTTSPDFAKNWGEDGYDGMTMDIAMKKGQKAAAIRAHDDSDGENEIIVQCGSMLRVVSFDFEKSHMKCELVQ